MPYKSLCSALLLILVSPVYIYPANALTTQDSFSEGLQNYLFTVAWVTDTQYLSKFYPDVLQQMVAWLNSEARNGKVNYVVLTGDLVDDWDNVAQWRTFTSYWGNLTMENDVLAGNHDNYGGTNWTYYDSYFPNRQYYSRSKNGWLFIFLSFSIIRESAVQNWLRNLIKAHNEKTVVLTHAYMSDTELITDGSYIYSILYESATKNFTVWSGHTLQAHKISYRTQGNTVGVLYNFQAYKNGGNGYLVLVDMYENGFYMRLYSVIENFDGKGRGKGYELSVVLFPMEQASSDSSEVSYSGDLLAEILVLISISAFIGIISSRLVQRLHRSKVIQSTEKI